MIESLVSKRLGFSAKLIMCWLTLAVGIFFAVQFGLSGWCGLFEPNQEAQKFSQQICLHIRLPRSLIAALCGACLGVAGMLLQGLFRNDLASPGILGIGSVANLFCIVAIVFFPYFASGNFALQICGFAGSGLGVFLLLCVMRGSMASPSRVLLLGVALSAIWTSLTMFVFSAVLEEHEKLARMLNWMMGGFNGMGWDELAFVLIPTGASLLWSSQLTKQLDLWSIHGVVAETVGLNVRNFQLQILILVAILVAVTSSLSGNLPFIGLIVPHIARLSGAVLHRELYLLVVPIGAILAVTADLCGRLVHPPLDIEAGVFTSLLGGPFFVWLLLRRSSQSERV